MHLDHDRGDEPPIELRDNLLMVEYLSEVVYRVGAAHHNLVEMQKCAKFLDDIPFNRTGLESAACAMGLLKEAFELLNTEKLRARDTVADAVGFLDAMTAARDRPPAGSSSAAASGGN